MTTRIEGWGLWVGGLAFGASLAIAAVLLGDATCGARSVLWLAKTLYSKVGVVVAGLLPLACWVVILAWRQWRARKASSRTQLDFAYIARTATMLGLLGTVISLALATTELATEVTNNSSRAILKVIPLVGQKLMSTIVGLLVALAADTALHLIERKEALRERE